MICHDTKFVRYERLLNLLLNGVSRGLVLFLVENPHYEVLVHLSGVFSKYTHGLGHACCVRVCLLVSASQCTLEIASSL